MLDSPMLVDQNMVCGLNTDQWDHFSRMYQVTFPFDPPTQSDTYPYTHTHHHYPIWSL